MPGDATSDALFGEGRAFTLPAGADFLGALSRTLIDITDANEKPEALGNALIFVPNRRSARALAARLFQDLGKPGFLPPDIRPLGDAGDNDPALLGELADIDIRPPMPDGARIGSLTTLVLKWHEARGREINLTSAVSAARDLARLLDQAALAGGVDWDALESQVEDRELAQHWEVSVEFLSIITKAWPAHLEEKGFSDTNEQDRLAAEAMCARWAHTPPETPVIIAGSTGSSPATRALMSAAMQLPKGAILFPGLDNKVDERTWEAISRAPSHPQFAFAETLNSLGVPHTSVALLPGYEDDLSLQPRRKLIQESLAPADTTADWVTRLRESAAPLSPEELTEQGLEGLSLIEADTEAEEAEAVALLMREALETPGESAALVTPDAGLARRVSALLKRWNVNVSPSAGWPLLQTRAGRFLMAALDWALDPGAPLAFARLLKHDLTYFSDEDHRYHAISVTERGVLRGLRRWHTLDQMGETAATYADDAAQHPGRAPITAEEYDLAIGLIEEFVGEYGPQLDAIADLTAEPFYLRAFTEALAEFADHLSKPNDETGPSMLWSGQDGAALSRFLEDLALLGDELPPVTTEDIRPLVTSLAHNLRVPDETPSHPRLFIWGPLEARLQSCDRLILSSLNEGSWPEAPGVDGFLPRQIRANIGLPDTEARIGLSAHDFAQLACAPNVVLTRSKRVADKPAVASRWLWRLRILASGALQSLDATDQRLTAGAAHILHWVRAQHLAPSAEPVRPPKPRPPLSARPDFIRVTDVEKLIRDPYAFYAKNVLRLEPLEAIDAPLSPLAIGIAMHTALEGADTLKTPYFTAPELVDRFADELRKVGADDLFIAEREAGWTSVSELYVDWMKQRDDLIDKRSFEVSYQLNLKVHEKTITLSGRADLVETLSNGGVTITDFKTGGVASNSQVTSGLAPQLPLLGAMAELTEEEGKPKGPPQSFFYVGFGASGGVREIEKDRKPVDGPELAHDTLLGLQDLLASFENPEMPYLAGPRIQFLYDRSDYDRLARKQEWADPGNEGSA